MTLDECKKFTKWLAVRAMLLVAVVFAAEALLIAMGFTLDDTDLSPVKRSGMKLLVDYKNGCQYLSTPQGGIMARYAPDGGHMGCIQGLPRAPVMQPQG